MKPLLFYDYLNHVITFTFFTKGWVSMRAFELGSSFYIEAIRDVISTEYLTMWDISTNNLGEIRVSNLFFYVNVLNGVIICFVDIQLVS